MFKGDGHVYQNAFIVDDLYKMIDHWIKDLGAGPFFVFENLRLDVEYRGTPSKIDINFALGQAGAVHIELIQVNSDNPTVYTDLRPKGGGGGFHHTGQLAKNFDEAIKAYEDAGYSVGMKGVFGNTPFAYVDTCSTLGFFSEFHEDTQEIRDFFQKVERASIGWNGERPIRPMAEIL